MDNDKLVEVTDTVVRHSVRLDEGLLQQVKINDEFMEWEERDSNSISFAKHCIAGSCAGISEHLGLYPIDTVKVSTHPKG